MLLINFDQIIKYLIIFASSWILFFPVVNLSTGEIKPRGLYVDENAYIAHFKSPVSFKHNLDMNFSMLNKEKNLEQLMLYFRTINGTECDLNHMILSCIVRNIMKPKSLESTILIFPIWFRHEDLKHVNDMNVTYSFDDSSPADAALILAKYLSSVTWASRNFIFMFLPVFKDDFSSRLFSRAGRYSSGLEYWLDKHFSHSNSYHHHHHHHHHHRSYINYGLIRDSFVLSFPPKRYGNSQQKHNTIFEKVRFSSVKFYISGFNGQLPNMDFLVTAKSVKNNNLVLTEAEDFLLYYYNQFKLVLTGSYLNTKTPFKSFQFAPPLESYLRKFLGLLSFSWSVVSGPTGLHGQFLLRNIESVTLEALPCEDGGDSSYASGSGSGSGCSSPPNKSQAVKSSVVVINMVLDNLVLQSRLHEELHHSLFYYLLMSSDTFVVLTTLSFFTSFFHLFFQTSLSLSI